MRRCRGFPRRFAIVLACVAFLVASCGSTAPGNSTPQTTDTGLGQVLVDFGDAGEASAWTTVNDPVMGGLSTSTVSFANGGLVFSGTISLENNGGFASARGPENPDLGRRSAGAKSLRVRAEGDGKTYLLRLGVAGQRWSYVQRFATEAAVDRIYDLPVDQFRAVGMRLDPAPDAPQNLDPSGIDQIAFYILDKQQGPFELTVRAVGAAA